MIFTTSESRIDTSTDRPDTTSGTTCTVALIKRISTHMISILHATDERSGVELWQHADSASGHLGSTPCVL